MLLTISIFFVATIGLADVHMPKAAEVSFTIASGNYGAVPETITAARSGDSCTIRLRRDQIGMLAAVDKTVKVEPSEFAIIWSLVEKGELYSYRPKLDAGIARDYGSRTLKIVTGPEGNHKPVQFEVSWDKPLLNGDSVHLLMKELGRLARARIKGSEPLFFP